MTRNLPAKINRLKEFYHSPLETKREGQILVTTLVVLLLVSLTVVVITATLARNARQVVNNLEYERNYNFSETKLLEVAEILADPAFDVSGLPSSGIKGMKCLVGTAGKTVCSEENTVTNTKTVITVQESNSVEAYDLSNEEYFDIRLDSGTGISYKGNVQIKWVGNTALDLSLIYEDNQAHLKSVHQIFDPTQNSTNKIYNSAGAPGSGFATNVQSINPNEIVISLSNLTNKIPANAKLKKIRAKVVNRELGSSITIRPSGGTTGFPSQVRVVEAFSYSINNIETATPVVKTQLPLAPQLPAFFTFGMNLNSVKQPMCGNNLIEGKEECDDGNTVDTDECTNLCQLPRCKLAMTTPSALNLYGMDKVEVTKPFSMHAWGVGGKIYDDSWKETPPKEDVLVIFPAGDYGGSPHNAHIAPTIYHYISHGKNVYFGIEDAAWADWGSQIIHFGVNAYGGNDRESGFIEDGVRGIAEIEPTPEIDPRLRRNGYPMPGTLSGLNMFNTSLPMTANTTAQLYITYPQVYAQGASPVYVTNMLCQYRIQPGQPQGGQCVVMLLHFNNGTRMIVQASGNLFNPGKPAGPVPTSDKQNPYLADWATMKRDANIMTNRIMLNYLCPRPII